MPRFPLPRRWEQLGRGRAFPSSSKPRGTMTDFSAFGLWGNLCLFAASTLIIIVCGTLLVPTADRIADRTRLGEALVGGVLLGASTSLSGTVTSVTAALSDHPSLAVSNAVGGIAAQTVFLAIADLFWRRANLEHASASITNLVQGCVLIFLLALPLVAAFAPEVTLLGVHPVSVLLVLFYAYGVRLSSRARKAPMWLPYRTHETREDVPQDDSFSGASTASLLLRFVLLVAVLGISGYVVARSGVEISARSGLSESFVGAFLTATATSMPELVTTIAAVRRGALTLAVGGIVGGNTFDVLFLVFADAAYQDGSIYHAVSDGEYFLFVWAMLMTSTLLAGLLRREKRGIGGIGFESAGLVLIYCAGLAIKAWMA